MFICSFIAVFIANSVYNVWLTDSVWYSISYEGVAFMAGTSGGLCLYVNFHHNYEVASD